ncbi:heme-binding protein 2-like [Pholidichthys leucotaenia]
MIFLSGLVCFLLILTAEARVGECPQSEFCSETKECLLYDVVCKTNNYEVRHYESATWVYTDESSLFREFALLKAFKRLYGYITGDNMYGKEIDMTTPVVVIKEMKKWWEFWKCDYTMAFLLPTEYQENPPKPYDDKVHIVTVPNATMYVKTFGGWMVQGADDKHAEELCKALYSVNAKFNNEVYISAVYNSPMVFRNRHNEVLLQAYGEPVCADGEGDSSSSSKEDHSWSWTAGS